MKIFIPKRRREIIEILEKDKTTAKKLADMFRVDMKYILEDLKHISQTVKIYHKKLKIEPAVCNVCGYVFKDRERLSRPTKCPKCRSEDITEPLFYIQ
jgi:hypothetical protein